MQITEAFKGKTLVITGGTGSFGSTVLKHFLTSDIGEIRIFSRDEKKQDWMRHTLQAQYPDYASKVQFYVGDVRNIDSVRDTMYGANYVFHAAALKEVPSCEFFPMEAVKTNIIGTDNVITAAVENKVERVVFLSTDKAAYPINSMGMTKAVGEKIVAARAQKVMLIPSGRVGALLRCRPIRTLAPFRQENTKKMIRRMIRKHSRCIRRTFMQPILTATMATS